MSQHRHGLSIRELSYAALAVVLLTVCAWISIPTTIPFTMQNFALFCLLLLLGGKLGTLAVAAYLLMGAVGLPVFSRMTGGLGALLGTTGGYLLGFLLAALVYWLLTALLGERLWVQVLALVLGLAIIYLFGTLWYVQVYTQSKGAITWGAALAGCVFPFVGPDLGKMALAVLLGRLLKKHVKL